VVEGEKENYARVGDGGERELRAGGRWERKRITRGWAMGEKENYARTGEGEKEFYPRRGEGRDFRASLGGSVAIAAYGFGNIFHSELVELAE
jgi:hypothetical protein